MHNLWLVIQREYITRVRRKAFILATLLTPLGLALFFVVVQFIFTYDNDEDKRIAVVDQGDVFSGPIADGDGLYFKFTEENIDTLKARIRQGGEEAYHAILVIPEISNPRSRNLYIEYFSDEPLSLDLDLSLRRKVEKAMRRYKTRALGLDAAAVAALETDVNVKARKLTVQAGESEDNSLAGILGAGLGSVMGFLMYLSIFIYGMMVMRSVMEEKMNRIVEVVISSVRPTTLLLGKIIGVGMVGLTQVLSWMILIPGVMFVVALLFGFDPDATRQMPNNPDLDPAEMQTMIEQVMAGLGEINWWLIIPCFILYFLAGYFMYAAMFAAIGSAMGDDMGEGQSLTMVVVIPVILAFYVMMAALQAPNSSLAVGGSIFPLFAPIVMPARLPFSPPGWEVAISLVSVLAFAGFMVWLAGRIYRVGILRYGKKGSLRDIVRWVFSKY